MEQASERVVTTIRRTVVPQRTRFDDAWVSDQGSREPPHGEGGLSDLESALLDLGMEDLIALPETLHAPETAGLLHRPTQAEAVARALVSLLESSRIQVWGGRWQDEPEAVDQQPAVKVLKDTSQYEFDSPTDRERRVFFVNVENLPAEPQ